MGSKWPIPARNLSAAKSSKHVDPRAAGLMLELRKEGRAPTLSPKVGGAGISAQYVRVPPGVEYGFDWRGSSHFLAFHDIRMREGETFADDLAVKRARDARDTFTFIPSGCRVWGWTATTKADNSFVAIYIDPRELRDELGSRMADAVLQPEVFFLAPALLGTIGKLRRALSEGEHIDRLYAESLCVLATTEFCRYRERRGGGSEEASRVGSVSIARIDEYIRAHMRSPIALDELAQVARLSRFHFVRTFKACSGETPYQRVLRIRMERAQELLEERRLNVAEIATAVGFTSPSRFIETFRRARGMTPGEFASAGGPKARRRAERHAARRSRSTD